MGDVWADTLRKAASHTWCYGGPQLVGPVVYFKTYVFNHFYRQYWVLLTMVPRYSCLIPQQQGFALLGPFFCHQFESFSRSDYRLA